MCFHFEFRLKENLGPSLSILKNSINFPFDIKVFELKLKLKMLLRTVSKLLSLFHLSKFAQESSYLFNDSKAIICTLCHLRLSL